jgi:peptidoglycan/LPS O-acetylase OafA/YrhL
MNDKNFYIPAIDGLRALAVVSVIINHFNHELLPSGFLGVDIFFVISGFVISASLINRQQNSGKAFFKGFYQRRIKRLLPALLFCFVVGALLISFFNPEPRNHLITGLYALIGFSNVELFLNSVDYWGEDAELNPFTHTWSLGVEEQFYLIFPLMLWLITKGKWSSMSLHKMFWFLTIFSGISLCFFVVLAERHQSATYFLMPFRFWEIGLGCALFILLKFRSIGFPSWLQAIPLWLLLSCTILTLFIPREFSVVATILVVGLTLATISKLVLLQSENDGNNNILSIRPIQYTGKISYSLYLWHWVVIVTGKWTWGIHYWTVPVLLLLIFICSIFSYHIIEKPMRHMAWSKSWKALAFLLSSLMIVGYFLFNVLVRTAGNDLYLGKSPDSSTYSEFPVEDLACQKPDIADRKRTFRTIGNSHAKHIVPMLQEIAEQCGFDVVYEKSQTNIIIPSGNNKFKDQIETVVDDLQKDDILVLSSRNRYLYQVPYLNTNADRWYDHTAIKKRRGYGLENWLDELDELLKHTSEKGIHVVLFLPNVEFDKQVVDFFKMCNKEWFRTEHPGCNPSVSRAFLNKRFPAEFYAEVQQRSELLNQFYVFDPEPHICPKQQANCSRVVNGYSAFIDTNHLSSNGARMLTVPFFNFLQKHSIIHLDRQSD